jgi:hypothetical protein
MRTLILCIVVSIALVSCASMPDDPNATTPDAYQGYQSWAKVNSHTITGDTTGVIGKAHEGTAGFREVYINSAGEGASNGASSLPYPVGTVIVKDSFKNAGGAKGALSAVTLMVKRSAQYDPGNGNWEYIMLTPKMKVQAQGRLSGCISCHLAADADLVFTDNR